MLRYSVLIHLFDVRVTSYAVLYIPCFVWALHMSVRIISLEWTKENRLWWQYNDKCVCDVVVIVCWKVTDLLLLLLLYLLLLFFNEELFLLASPSKAKHLSIFIIFSTKSTWSSPHQKANISALCLQFAWFFVVSFRWFF